MVPYYEHIDLFSGIGGFALACQWAGIQTVQFVEIDKFCQKVLAKNFPGVPIHNDIKTFTYAECSGSHGTAISISERESRQESTMPSRSYSKSHPFLLTGGFPCQPFSYAGKRRGKEDDRYLWPEMLRVVSEAKPRYVIGENVAGFIGMGLDECISDLENQSYEVQAFVIPACAVNAPHRRDRVWIVGDATSQGRQQIRGWKSNEGRTSDQFAQSDCHAADTEGKHSRTGLCEDGQKQDGDQLTDSRGDVADASGKGFQEREMFPGNLRTEQPPAIGRPWAENWPEVAARLCRMDARISNRMDRLKCLGNAIVPQVAYQIIKAIVEVEKQNDPLDIKP